MAVTTAVTSGITAVVTSATIMAGAITTTVAATATEPMKRRGARHGASRLLLTIRTPKSAISHHRQP